MLEERAHLHRHKRAVGVEILGDLPQHGLVSDDVEGAGLPLAELGGQGIHRDPVPGVGRHGGEHDRRGLRPAILGGEGEGRGGEGEGRGRGRGGEQERNMYIHVHRTAHIHVYRGNIQLYMYMQTLSEGEKRGVK